MKGHMEKAAHYSFELEKLLSNQEIFQYPPNANKWIFTLQGCHLTLKDMHAKLSYMYFTIALTDMLNHPDSIIASKIHTACNALMKSQIKKDYLKTLVLFQAKQVYDEHTLYHDPIKKFWAYVSCEGDSRGGDATVNYIRP